MSLPRFGRLLGLQSDMHARRLSSAFDQRAARLYVAVESARCFLVVNHGSYEYVGLVFEGVLAADSFRKYVLTRLGPSL